MTSRDLIQHVKQPVVRVILRRQIIYVVTHGLFVQTVFGMIVRILLAIEARQSAPDSAMRKWEASLKEKSASKKASEDTSA